MNDIYRYKDQSEPDKIGLDGVVKFLEDLQLDPNNRTVLIIAWKFKAQTQCEFSKEEFLGGMMELGCDSIDKLKSKLPNLEKEILDQNKFKEFYQFTFNYAKNPSQKVIVLIKHNNKGGIHYRGIYILLVVRVLILRWPWLTGILLWREDSNS